MAKLEREYWETLKKHKLAFEHWDQKVFNFLLDRVYGPSPRSTAKTANPMKVDEDTLMIYLVRQEPPTKPGEPQIGPP